MIPVDGGVAPVAVTAASPVLVACAHGTRNPTGRRLIAELALAARRPAARADDDGGVRRRPAAHGGRRRGRAVRGRAGRPSSCPLLLSGGYHVHVDIAGAVAGVAGRGRRPPARPGPAAGRGAARPAGRRPAPIPRDPLTAVVLAAAGSSDVRAVADVEDTADLLQRSWAGPVTTGYGSAAQPTVPDAVAAARRAGAERVVVAAYLLAPGHFHDKLAGAGADVVTAPLLPDDRIAAVLLDRYDAALVGGSRGMNASSEVDDWFAARAHPLTDAMQRARRLILEADPRVTESIKWKTPTFAFRGNIVSFNPAKNLVSLLFHRGAEIPGDFPRLEGDGRLVRTMRFADVGEVDQAADELQAVIRAWCDPLLIRPASRTPAPPARGPARRRPPPRTGTTGVHHERRIAEHDQPRRQPQPEHPHRDQHRPGDHQSAGDVERTDEQVQEAGHAGQDEGPDRPRGVRASRRQYGGAGPESAGADHESVHVRGLRRRRCARQPPGENRCHGDEQQPGAQQRHRKPRAMQGRHHLRDLGRVHALGVHPVRLVRLGAGEHGHGAQEHPGHEKNDAGGRGDRRDQRRVRSPVIEPGQAQGTGDGASRQGHGPHRCEEERPRPPPRRATSAVAPARGSAAQARPRPVPRGSPRPHL